MEYDGIETLRVPAEMIWKPDIVLYNKYVHPTASLFPKLPLAQADPKHGGVTNGVWFTLQCGRRLPSQRQDKSSS